MLAGAACGKGIYGAGFSESPKWPLGTPGDGNIYQLQFLLNSLIPQAVHLIL